MFEWQQEYSVGIHSIDGQHQNLFRIGRELYSAMSAGQGRIVTRRLLDRLVQYTAVHFAHEERLMLDHGYAEYAAHKAEHEALSKKVIALQAEFASGRIAINVELLQFLKTWLESHIRESDQRYASCLRAKLVA